MACARSLRRRVGFASLVLLTAHSTAVAATIRLAPGESAPVITGQIGNDASFTRRIALVADAAVSAATVHVSELDGPQGARISGSQITLSPGGKIQVGTDAPTYVDIKVTGVKTFGDYKGTIAFLVAGQPASTAVPVSLLVTAKSVPTLTARKGSDPLKIQRSDCSGWGCDIAELFEPAVASPVFLLAFNNPTPEPFEMIGSVDALGDVNQGALGPFLTLQQPIGVSVGPIFKLPISFGSVTPHPDRYVGDIQFRLPGREDPLKLSLEVNVRSGPVVPIFVLLIGVALGRVAKYMKEHGNAQAELLLALYRLEDRIARPEDQALLQPMLLQVRSKINKLELEAAKTDLDGIERRFTLLETLHGLEAALEPHIANGAAAQIVAEIANARGLIGSSDDQAAMALVTKIQGDIRALNAGPAPGTRSMTMALDAASARAQRAAVRAARRPKRSKVAGFIVRGLTGLTGIAAEARAELALWVARPVLYILLVIGVLYLGLQQLYIKNPMFGASPFVDYFGLLVWAMSADVASRSISTLKTGA